jgi:hypothetical protein
MPNHCQNTLTVTGPENFLCIFRNEARKEKWAPKTDFLGQRIQPLELVHSSVEFSFDKFVPMPTHLYERTHPNPEGLPTWYEWAEENWGTKWDAYDVCLEFASPGQLVYKFTTANSPPDEFLKRLSAAFPMLDFRLLWHEEGGCFGRHSYDCGVEAVENHGDTVCLDGGTPYCPLCDADILEDEEIFEDVTTMCLNCGLSWTYPKDVPDSEQATTQTS